MAEEKKDALAKAAPTALAPVGNVLAPVPDYLKDDEKEGLEDITRKDMSIPRLALAQAQSPQVTEGDPNLIPDLKPGDLFNPVTKKIYGRSVEFMVVHKDKPRAMLLRSIDEGGGVIDPDVPLNSPLLKWGTSGNKKEDKPKATEFRDFVAVLLPEMELIALSFKSSGIKVAKALNGLIAMRGKSIYAGKYKMTTGTQLTPKPHKVFLVENADWVTPEQLAHGKNLYNGLKALDAAEIASRIHGANDDDFDPEALEREAIQNESNVVEEQPAGNVGKM